MSENQGFLQARSTASGLARKSAPKRHLDKTVIEPGQEKLLQLVFFVEELLFVRWQELGDRPDQNEERITMDAVAEGLRAIKINTLHWPAPRP